MDAPATTSDTFPIPGLELADLELAIHAQQNTESEADDIRHEGQENDLAERELLIGELLISTGLDQHASDADLPIPAAEFTPELETVELELALQHEDLIKLTFEDSLKTALDRLGGRLLFDMRLDNAIDDCQRVAAVTLGDGDDKQFALVIMPEGGGSIRVEAAEASGNPLAAIAQSYEGVMTALKMAA